VQGLENIKLIAVGAFHNLALQEDGTLWAWGNNEYGQLGTGDTQPRSQPIHVQGLSGLTVVCISQPIPKSSCLFVDHFVNMHSSILRCVQ
jgi:alpha-tubulin suppressor-like RCC1 family protein